MVGVSVENRAGEVRTIDAGEGLSLMEALRESGFGEVMALCGGCCSCATCHVVIDDAYTGLLPAMSPDENDLLDSVDDRASGSRLSCQIPLVSALDGIRVRLVAEG
ncbi:2Fe-2S iron-sulfur cluster-binding protein [Novosphingobium sp. MD-1]|uniref:2Fe-2S iron-sulfur cluster-binding protein n=1 Tax=Novosphingobium sp. MD-1 TaxID=1630648 RepID=UPI00061C62B3|nr:2Fe-2S iron-sulfur cluster-binding protein [Novosphingobium sp. MD-1]GAO53275.1 ferredoxin, 2Fe-2S [Novosphingobium sp. MD-1]